MIAMNATRDLVSSGLGRVKQQATAVASTVSPYLVPKMSAGELVASGLGRVRSEAAAAVATREGAARAAALVIGGAVGVYFLLPAAAAPAAAGAMMKAPGAAGFVVSRVAFLANKQLYFKVLHTAGAAAAVAVLA
ncbi:protein EGG APPARATUS-1 [Brachypodium distachyon]|uniref:Uncharacterized protein n=1 Tax=Brachypodium distachyon TaxID=15368 RepID=A0A0Q3GXT6_BRADI|nr:protein EGG APPARATUS-1 [Brachypodium distachyon]KQK15325.1 hypothetical protein BRADI_1g21950v3 [Brachypodium distachyon]|eukprot:XP_003559981.2 protein EGG APPARATUS-1 [Brachypodium distachyon]